MSDTAVSCQDLVRTFTSRTLRGGRQEHVALKGINIEIPRGIVFGLLGPNGAGKTTTVRILSTLLTPTSGKVTVLGYDVEKDTAMVRRHIGFVLGGDRGLYTRLTARENLQFFAALNHVEPKEADRRADELLRMVNLDDRRSALVEQFSRGMKQRLHIARGLLTDPDVVFLDEPTIGLDPLLAQEVRAIVPRLTAAGKTVLLTTHYMFEADALCDRLALINQGEIVAKGTPSEIKNRLSGLRVIEVRVRAPQPAVLEQIDSISGVLRTSVTADGLLQLVSIHIRQGSDLLGVIGDRLSGAGLESITEREPTLEEAYLEILGAPMKAATAT